MQLFTYVGMVMWDSARSLACCGSMVVACLPYTSSIPCLCLLCAYIYHPHVNEVILYYFT